MCRTEQVHTQQVAQWHTQEGPKAHNQTAHKDRSFDPQGWGTHLGLNKTQITKEWETDKGFLDLQKRSLIDNKGHPLQILTQKEGNFTDPPVPLFQTQKVKEKKSKE